MYIATKGNASNDQRDSRTNCYQGSEIPWCSRIVVNAWRKDEDSICSDNSAEDAEESKCYHRSGSGVEDIEVLRVAVRWYWLDH